MTAPAGHPGLTTIRRIARKVADGAPESEVRLWPYYTKGERGSLETSMAERLGLNLADRRRSYFKLALLAAMNAFDIRMSSRQATIQRTVEPTEGR